VAYQCLTGRVPFHGDPLAVALAHREQPLPPLPSSVPADVAALVADLTAKDPSARPASAGEVAERAEYVRDVLTAPGAVRHRGKSRPIARLAARAALILAAIMTTAAASWVATGLRGPAPGHPQPGPSATVRHPSSHGRHPGGRVAPADVSRTRAWREPEPGRRADVRLGSCHRGSLSPAPDTRPRRSC
jgi:eukaryotic-like serine/threonine-protein kinase